MRSKNSTPPGLAKREVFVRSKLASTSDMDASNPAVRKCLPSSLFPCRANPAISVL